MPRGTRRALLAASTSAPSSPPLTCWTGCCGAWASTMAGPEYDGGPLSARVCGRPAVGARDTLRHHGARTRFASDVRSVAVAVARGPRVADTSTRTYQGLTH
eukprot:7362333-Prymnesium_polylepis.1